MTGIEYTTLGGRRPATRTGDRFTLEWTAHGLVRRPDETHRSSGVLEYTAPHRGIGVPFRSEGRRRDRTGEPAAPYASRLAGLPPRTTADWSGFVSGCATVYDTPLSDGHGGTELFQRQAFTNDHGVEVPILLLHDWERHVGWATLDHRTDGLHFTGQLNRGGARRVGNWRGISLCFVPASLPGRTPGRRNHYHARTLELSVLERGTHHPHSYIRLVGDAALAA